MPLDDERPSYSGTPLLASRLDEALDDLPRYFSVIEQPANGWYPWQTGDGPSMVTCVTVADVRKMLRREVSKVGTTGVHVPTIQWVIDWLRGDEAEKCRAYADENGTPPEDELAQALEHRWLA